MSAYELKRLGARNLEAALAKAEQYRALNEPEEAESICRDVLADAPADQRALKTLGLALTDRLAEEWTRFFDDALATFAKLEGAYERVYYTGVAWERCAKAQLARNQVHAAAHSMTAAMSCFAEAEQIGPKDAPDPILRWNRCVRAIEAHPEMREAMDRPSIAHEFQHGD